MGDTNNTNLNSAFTKIDDELEKHKNNVTSLHSNFTIISAKQFRETYQNEIKSLEEESGGGSNGGVGIHHFIQALESFNRYPKNIRKPDKNKVSPLAEVVSTIDADHFSALAPEENVADHAYQDFKEFISAMNNVKVELDQIDADLQPYTERLSRIGCCVREVKKKKPNSGETCSAFSKEEEKTIGTLSANIEHLNFRQQSLMPSNNLETSKLQNAAVSISNLMSVKSSNEIL